MISVNEALDALFALVRPLSSEEVSLRDAEGRVMTKSVTADRDQPPFASSAMDGYAVRAEDARTGATLRVIGASAAGHRFAGAVGSGEAVRIFTGAPVPEGADRVVIQEDVTAAGDMIEIGPDLGTSLHIRAAGIDFHAGETFNAPHLLTPGDVALLASMNIPDVEVARRPEIALISTGDELIHPGETPGPDQIIASNTYGLDALFRKFGARSRILPIARDTKVSLRNVFELAKGADLIVTIGGASVGDHDLVAPVSAELGMERSFYKVAMRPGKPLMAGRMGPSFDNAMMIGLPGNPVSALICGYLFIGPVLRAMQGLPGAPVGRLKVPLTISMPENGPREHYVRARLDENGIAPLSNQDSSLLSVLSQANGLIRREAGAPAAQPGDIIEYVPL